MAPVFPLQKTSFRRAALFGVAVGLGTGGILAVSGEAQTPSGKPIHLVTKNYHYALVDTPPKHRGRGPGTGDSMMLAAITTDAAGKRVGSFDAVMAITDSARGGRAVGQAIYTLPDGQVHAMFRGSTADRDGATRVASVVGGTGAYTGVRGSITSVDRKGTAGGDASDDTIALLP